MNGPYLVMATEYGKWHVIEAWATKSLAHLAANRIMADATKKMGVKETHRWKGWKPWKPWGHQNTVSFGKKFPGKLINAWSANSVGGDGGNQWTNIAVIELVVSGTVLDHIAENI